MQEKSVKIFKGVLGATNVLFAVYYIMLSVFNRMHFDDVHFMWLVDEKGVLDFVKYIYMRHSGRYFDYFMDGLAAKFTLLTDVYFFWPILYYGIGVWLTWIFAKTFFNKGKLFGFLGVLFGYNLYILTSMDLPTFFWLCASTYYIFGPAALALLALLNKRNMSKGEYVLVALLCLFVGGTFEVYTPRALLLLGGMALYYLYSKQWKLREALKMSEVNHLLIGIVTVTILWLINIAGPGNYVRMDNVGEAMIVHPQSEVEFVKGILSCVGMFTYFSVFYFPHYICMLAVFILIGRSTSNSTIEKKEARKYIWIGVCLFAALFLVGTIPVVYLYNGFGIYRYWTLYGYLLAILVCGIGYCIGRTGSKCLAVYQWVSYIGVIGIAFCVCVSLWYDGKSAYRFAKSVDQRKDLILQLQTEGNADVVQVPPYEIPYTIDSKYLLYKCMHRKKNSRPVLYYYSDADIVPNAYVKYIRHAYHVDFDFVTTETTNMP